MSLQVWLPLNGNLENQGLSDVTVTNNSSVSVDDSGKIGKCYYFNRTNYLTTPIPFSTTTSMSLAFWIKIPETYGSNQQIIHIGKGSGWVNNRFIALIKYSTYQIVFHISDGTNTISYNCISTALTQNEWTHVSCTYENHTMKIYINGILNKIYTISYDPSFTDITNIGYGAAPNGQEKGKMYLNDIRIYDHCLSDKEVKELSKGLVLHYKLSGVGGENLSDFSSIKSNWTMDGLTGSDYTDPDYGNVIKLDSASTYKRMYHYCNWTADTTYAVSFLAKSSVDGISCDMSRSIANFSQAFTLSTSWKRYEGVINSTVTATNGTLSFRIHDANATVFITQIKLELGNKATIWIPYSSNSAYTFLDYNDTIEYDHSGFGNDGVKTNITTDVDTPRYSTSYLLNGSSYIKTTNNAWMSQYAQEMTVNIWAYAEDWTTQTNAHLFSCTESGGFNTENGASGYLRHPIYVATNAEQTTYAYKYNNNGIKLADLTPGWHMFTFIYTTSNQNIYVDGEIESTYANTSYGIRFNTNARLFLGCEAATATQSAPYFNGKLSDFRIFYTALSEKDIKELYTVGTAFDKQGRVMTYEVVEV